MIEDGARLILERRHQLPDEFTLRDIYRKAWASLSTVTLLAWRSIFWSARITAARSNGRELPPVAVRRCRIGGTRCWRHDMGRWIAELKKCENAETGHCQNRQNPDERGFVSFVSLSSGQIREFFAPDANDYGCSTRNALPCWSTTAATPALMRNGWRARRCSAAALFPMTRSTP